MLLSSHCDIFYIFQLKEAINISENCHWPQPKVAVHFTRISSNLDFSNSSFEYLNHRHWTTDILTFYWKELWIVVKVWKRMFYFGHDLNTSLTFIFHILSSSPCLRFFPMCSLSLQYYFVFFSTLRYTLNIFCALTEYQDI